MLSEKFGPHAYGEWCYQVTEKFSELSYEDKLYIVRLLEKRGYRATDRDEWVA